VLFGSCAGRYPIHPGYGSSRNTYVRVTQSRIWPIGNTTESRTSSSVRTVRTCRIPNSLVEVDPDETHPGSLGGLLIASSLTSQEAVTGRLQLTADLRVNPTHRRSAGSGGLPTSDQLDQRSRTAATTLAS
jgi:hypothetical protein